jgi:hypothetical protein
MSMQRFRIQLSNIRKDARSGELDQSVLEPLLNPDRVVVEVNVFLWFRQLCCIDRQDDGSQRMSRILLAVAEVIGTDYPI